MSDDGLLLGKGDVETYNHVGYTLQEHHSPKRIEKVYRPLVDDDLAVESQYSAFDDSAGCQALYDSYETTDIRKGQKIYEIGDLRVSKAQNEGVEKSWITAKCSVVRAFCNGIEHVVGDYDDIVAQDGEAEGGRLWRG